MSRFLHHSLRHLALHSLFATLSALVSASQVLADAPSATLDPSSREMSGTEPTQALSPAPQVPTPTAVALAPNQPKAELRWRGPLAVENERPLQSLFMFARPQSPGVLQRGQQELGVQLDVANNLLLPRQSANGARVEEDFETQKLRLSLARGLGRGVQVELETRLLARNGGILDSSIDFYHRLLGLPGVGQDNPRGRGAIPNNRSHFFFRDANGNGVNEGSAFGLGDSIVTLKKQLSGGRTPIAARAMLKFPTGSQSHLLGSGGLDAGLSIDARLPIANRVALYAQAGAYAWGASDIPNARSNGLSGSLALEYRGRRTSIIAQTLGQSRVVRTGVPFADRTPVIVSVGFKRDVGRDKLLWACFSENGDYNNFRAPFLGNIGPDYTLSVGMTWRR